MNSLSRLTDRKKRILEFVIKEYIETAEPVGSRTISKNKDLGISAATIRNEMSDLEELGLLLQPYTSAGRIPSQEAYELYIKNFLKVNNDSYRNEITKTNLVLNNVNKIAYLIEESLNILSDETDYTAIALSQRNFSKHYISKINLTKISSNQVVLVVILNDGDVKNTLIESENIVEDIDLLLIENVLNENLKGLYLYEINDELLEKITFLVQVDMLLLEEILHQIIYLLNNHDFVDLSLMGTTKMFNQPEFSDIEKAKSLIDFLANKDDVRRLLETKGIDKNGLNIILGNEQMGEAVKDVAIISADINYDGEVIGKIGIIAPKRMDYNKAYSVVNYMQRHINSIINDL